MANSSRYKELTKRANQLKRHMLPNEFSAIGEYSERQLDRVSGYRLLIHAEIESYLEDVSKNIVVLAISKWKENQAPSATLIAFLASYHSGWNIESDTDDSEIIKIARSRKKKDSIDEIIDLAQAQFIQKLSCNHGIKEKNLQTLILPTSIVFEDLESSWVADLNNFGSLRGEVAHKAQNTTREINPSDEHDLVKKLMIGLKELDSRLEEAKKKIA